MKLRIISIIMLLALSPGCRAMKHTSPAIATNAHRVAIYNNISTKLALLSNEDLSGLIEQKTSGHHGVGGGTTGSIEVDGTTIFFKKINLTDLEQQQENIMSTKNMFNLPTGLCLSS